MKSPKLPVAIGVPVFLFRAHVRTYGWTAEAVTQRFKYLDWLDRACKRHKHCREKILPTLHKIFRF